MNEELDPGLVPEPDPIPVPNPVPDPTPPPVLEVPPEEQPTPIEVITVDELLDRLTPEENTELELPTDGVEAGIEDIPVDPDPVTLILDQVIGKLIALNPWNDYSIKLELTTGYFSRPKMA